MQTVIITVHLLVVIALVGVVLIQRSEGGGLGIGGGSGFMTARGTKNALTRMTAILAACFFVTSILLTALELAPGKDGSNILKQIPQNSGAPSGGLLDQLGGKSDSASEAAPVETAPAQNTAPAEPAPAGDDAAQGNAPQPAESQPATPEGAAQLPAPAEPAAPPAQ